jgi:hypothetical protein
VGAVLSLASGGGTATSMAGTTGFRPRALDVVSDAGTDTIYFAGSDATSGVPGVFKISGGAVSAVITDAALGDPSGVAATKAGDLYVANVSSYPAEIIQVTAGAPANFVGGLKLGYPAGIALSQDESALLVSGINPDTGTSIVYRIVIATKEITMVDQSISNNRESAGLHRAHDLDTYAWGGEHDVYHVSTGSAPVAGCP